MQRNLSSEISTTHAESATGPVESTSTVAVHRAGETGPIEDLEGREQHGRLRQYVTPRDRVHVRRDRRRKRDTYERGLVLGPDRELDARDAAVGIFNLPPDGNDLVRRLIRCVQVALVGGRVHVQVLDRREDGRREIDRESVRHGDRGEAGGVDRADRHVVRDRETRLLHLRLEIVGVLGGVCLARAVAAAVRGKVAVRTRARVRPERVLALRDKVALLARREDLRLALVEVLARVAVADKAHEAVARAVETRLVEVDALGVRAAQHVALLVAPRAGHGRLAPGARVTRLARAQARPLIARTVDGAPAHRVKDAVVEQVERENAAVRVADTAHENVVVDVLLGHKGRRSRKRPAVVRVIRHGHAAEAIARAVAAEHLNHSVHAKHVRAGGARRQRDGRAGAAEHAPHARATRPRGSAGREVLRGEAVRALGGYLTTDRRGRANFRHGYLEGGRALVASGHALRALQVEVGLARARIRAEGVCAVGVRVAHVLCVDT
eukprot:Opistho-1_new@92914